MMPLQNVREPPVSLVGVQSRLKDSANFIISGLQTAIAPSDVLLRVGLFLCGELIVFQRIDHFGGGLGVQHLNQ
jgi:hypothetical protein